MNILIQAVTSYFCAACFRGQSEFNNGECFRCAASEVYPRSNPMLAASIEHADARVSRFVSEKERVSLEMGDAMYGGDL